MLLNFVKINMKTIRQLTQKLLVKMCEQKSCLNQNHYFFFLNENFEDELL